MESRHETNINYNNNKEVPPWLPTHYALLPLPKNS